jgi:hypothetical protein
MTTTRSLLLLTLISPVALLLPGCGKQTESSTAPAVQMPAPTAKDLAADIKAAAAESWASIKDYSYEKRDDFAAGLERMTAKHEAAIGTMNAKLTGLSDDAAKARDAASKEFADALADLKVQTAHLRTGSAEMWGDAKAKIAQSWERVQTAYEKLKASPTA